MIRATRERYANVPTIRDGFNYVRCGCCDEPTHYGDMIVEPEGFGGDDICAYCVEDADG